MTSEPAFGDEDCITGTQLEGQRDLAAVELPVDRAADVDRTLVGARREAARDGDGGLRRHVGDVGILARCRDLADDEERPIGLDFDRHMRLADVAVAQLAGDRLRQPGGGLSACRYGADQRHGDVAGGVHRVGVGEAVLAEHDDAQLVAGVEQIGRRTARRAHPGCMCVHSCASAGRSKAMSVADELDLKAVGRAVLRKKFWVIGPTILVAILTFAAVNMMTPRYKSEARILIEGRENVFLRPEAEKLAERDRVDPETVTSQVQLVLSRDLARKVIKDLKLGERAEFDPVIHGVSPLRHVMSLVGIGKDPLKMSPEERVLEAYYERLTAFPVDKSRVISVEFSSADPELAALAANAVAQAYLELQQIVRQDQTRMASQWLGSEIETLRKRVAEAEAKVEDFRARSNLFVGTNNTTLSSQQLGELNTQLGLARSQKADAEAKAQMIRSLLTSGQPLESSDIVNAELLRRLAEQGATLRAQLAEQSSTLLGNHPRIKELKAQIADLDGQIRREGEKLVRSLENDARIAGARVESLGASLDQLKRQAATTGEQDVQLRALEREAKAQRDLLESLLAKYREANARDSLSLAPGEARVISRAIMSSTPSFPRKMPIVVIATLATFLLSLAFVTTGEFLAGNVYRQADLMLEDELLFVPATVEPDMPAPTLVPEPAFETVMPDRYDAPPPADPREPARKAITELVEALRAKSAERQAALAAGAR